MRAIILAAHHRHCHHRAVVRGQHPAEPSEPGAGGLPPQAGWGRRRLVDGRRARNLEQLRARVGRLEFIAPDLRDPGPA
jgi:hypothetical protein